jgi:hypothetical protein
VCTLAAAGYWWRAAHDQPEISGRWKAELSAPGEESLPLYLDLEVAGNRLLGTVRYPTGDSGIRDGTREGNRISFQTRHVPQFETEPVVIRFEGQLADSELKLVMQTDQGVRHLTGIRQK